MNRQRIVFYADSPKRASAFRDLLASYGIDATVESDSGRRVERDMETECPRVLVSEDDYEFAYELATDFDAGKTDAKSSPRSAGDPATTNPQRASGRSSGRDAERSAEQREFIVHEWPDWPRCPRCDRRRDAVCPSCGNRDSDIRVAQSPDSLSLQDLAESMAVQGDEWRDEDGDFVPLVCRVCDAAFAARFSSTCRQCQWEFPDGVSGPPARTLADVLNYRTLFIAALVVALLYAIWMFLMNPVHDA